MLNGALTHNFYECKNRDIYMIMIAHTYIQYIVAPIIEEVAVNYYYCLPDGSDYSLMPQVLTFSDSITVQQVVPIIIPDDLVEDEEYFGITLEIVDKGAINVRILPSQVTVNIVDMDGKFVIVRIISVPELIRTIHGLV